MNIIKNPINKIARIVIVLTGILFAGDLFCQKNNIDSIYKVYQNKLNHDTVRISALLNIGRIMLVKDPDSSISVLKNALSLSTEKKIFKFQASACLGLGNSYKNKSEYLIALEFTKRSLDIASLNNDQIAMAKAYNALGQLYARMSDFKKATECYIKNLEIYESLKRPDLKGNGLQNLGNLYFKLENYPEALNYYNKCFELQTALKNKEGIAQAIHNKSEVFKKTNKYDSALNFSKRSLKLFQELGNEQLVSSSYASLADIYSKKGKLDSSLAFYDAAIKISTESKDKVNTAKFLCYKSDVLYQKGDLQEAKKNVLVALEIANNSLNLMVKRDCYFQLATVNRKLREYEEALKNIDSFMRLKDTILVLQSKNEVSDMTIRHQYNEKNMADSLKLSEEQKVVKAQLEKEKTIKWSFLIGLLLFAIFAVFMFNRYRVTSRQKSIIEDKEQETNKQKLIIEEKQKEILDSINYAKRIQSAYLPPVETFHKVFKNAFLLFKPKDIVSGDFYWFFAIPKPDKKGATIFCAVADCTGHGVPGALMSVICSNALNDAVISQKINDTGQILNETRRLVKRSLKSTSYNGQKDGMDIALIKLDTETGDLWYSGAYNPLWIIKNQELIELIADKQPIGVFDNEKEFTVQHISLNQGDLIYLFSDGYADQFGGEKGKKFKYKKLNEALVKLSPLPLNEQKEQLDLIFENWKGKLDQVDDVCLVCIKV